MSHFVVLVEADDEAHLTRLLVPFKEAGCGSEDPPELAQYLEFRDEEDEVRADWESGTCRRYVNEVTGEHDFPWADRFAPPGAFGITSHPLPAGWVEKEMTLKEIYANDFLRYVKEWKGFDAPDPRTGRYGVWRNPNQKWDWWQVGGRYSARLVLKDGRRADDAPAGQVDWAATAGKVVWSDSSPENSRVPFFAVLTRTGQWAEKGKMGWWACVSNRDDAAFDDFYKNFLATVDPGQRVYVVDAHI